MAVEGALERAEAACPRIMNDDAFADEVRRLLLPAVYRALRDAQDGAPQP